MFLSPRTTSLPAIALALVVSTGAGRPAPAQDPPADRDRIGELERQVADLRKRVAELEALVRDLRNGAEKGARGRELSPERAACDRMKSIATAQADFRCNDRDGNRMNDFWVGDLHGLYALTPSLNGTDPGTGTPDDVIRLIEPDLAGADASPLRLEGLGAPPPDRPKPLNGYLFSALRRDSQGLPYGRIGPFGADPPTAYSGHHNFSRFGFAAYPAEYGRTGRLAFLVNEDNVVWAKDMEGVVPEAFPADPRREGWVRME